MIRSEQLVYGRGRQGGVVCALAMVAFGWRLNSTLEVGIGRLRWRVQLLNDQTQTVGSIFVKIPLAVAE